MTCFNWFLTNNNVMTPGMLYTITLAGTKLHTTKCGESKLHECSCDPINCLEFNAEVLILDQIKKYTGENGFLYYGVKVLYKDQVGYLFHVRADLTLKVAT